MCKKGVSGIKHFLRFFLNLDQPSSGPTAVDFLCYIGKTLSWFTSSTRFDFPVRLSHTYRARKQKWMLVSWLGNNWCLHCKITFVNEGGYFDGVKTVFQINSSIPHLFFRYDFVHCWFFCAILDYKWRPKYRIVEGKSAVVCNL